MTRVNIVPDNFSDMLAQFDAERIAAMNTPEALKQEAETDARRAERWAVPCPKCREPLNACECPSPPEETCEECGNSEDDCECDV